MGVSSRLMNKQKTALIGFTCVILPVLLQLTKASSIGFCLRVRYRSANGCGQTLRSGVSRERCCTGHYRRAWSPNVSPTHTQGHRLQGHTLRNLTSEAVYNQMWTGKESRDTHERLNLQWQHRHHHQQNCQPCTTSCDSVRCGEDRKCILRHGIPKCVCSPKCQLQHKEAVCGTDGRTYASECQLMKRACRKKQRLLVAHSGPCQTCRGIKCRRKRSCVLDELLTPRCRKCPTSCKGNKRRRPICGTDDVTYKSKCFLKMASCKAGLTIKRAYKGPCRENALCEDVKCWKGETCIYDYTTKKPQCWWCGDPPYCSYATHICASDKKIYKSWCALKHASCSTGMALTAIPLHNCPKYSTKSKAEDKKCPPKSVEAKQKLVDGILTKQRRPKRLKVVSHDTLKNKRNNKTRSSSNDSTITELIPTWELHTEANKQLHSTERKKKKIKRRKGFQKDDGQRNSQHWNQDDC